MYIEFLVLVNEDDWLFNLYIEMYELLWKTLYVPHEPLCVCVLEHKKISYNPVLISSYAL